MHRSTHAALLMLLALGTGTAAAEPGADRQSELLYRLRHDCGSCHGLTMKGGLGPPLLPMTLAYTPEGVLIDAILGGIPGTPMPPWAFEITRDEVAWLVRNLKRGLPDVE